MDFKKATDALCEAITHEDVAKAVKRSAQAVRQARAAPGSNSYRPPPDGWREAVIRLAEARAARLQSLAAKLRAETSD